MDDFIEKYSKWFPYCEKYKLKDQMRHDLSALGNTKTMQDCKNKLYLKAWAFNRKKYRKFVINTMRGIEKGLAKDAKKGKYSSTLTTDEDRLENHYLHAIAFRWLLRYSKYKPTLEDERIFVSKTGKRYIEMMQIKFNWDLSNGHVD